VAAGGSTQTVFTTPSLAVGTWEIKVAFDVQISNASITGSLELSAIVGSATATFDGDVSASVSGSLLIATTNRAHVTYVFFVTVTVAGTIIIQAVNNDNTYTYSLRVLSAAGGYSDSSGYTAVRVA
jgi:hypothetical protein